jgi:ATP-dependent RNA helicase DeaD
MTQDFSGFGLPAKLVQALSRMQYTEPTPIQAQTIPIALEGKDILGSAQTGTGKTAAFGIPLVAHLIENPKATALVLTPTRELAVQVLACLQKMVDPQIKTALLIGGEPIFKQFSQLRRSPRLIVGTPGRINDHLERSTLNLENADFLVLDETDRMLDMGFGIQLDQIIEYLPAERQTLMFSATLPSAIVKLSAKYMNDFERVAVGSLNTPVSKIKQEMIHTTEDEKYQHLVTQLEQRDGSIIIFVKTKQATEYIAEKLRRDNHLADAIHGDLQQRRRERVLQNFRNQKYRILVATDVAARGLDVPHIKHVINYDMPQCPEDYIHRVGRTARAGAEGCAVNLLTRTDTSKWRAIHRLINPEEARKERSEREPRIGSSGFGSRSRGFNQERFGGGRDRRGFGRREDGFDRNKRFGSYRSDRREGEDSKSAFWEKKKKVFFKPSGKKSSGAAA